MSTVREVFTNWDHKSDIKISHNQLLTVDIDDCMIAIYITHQYGNKGVRCRIELSTEFEDSNSFYIPHNTKNIDNIVLFIKILSYLSWGDCPPIFIDGGDDFSDDPSYPYKQPKEHAIEVLEIMKDQYYANEIILTISRLVCVDSNNMDHIYKNYVNSRQLKSARKI